VGLNYYFNRDILIFDFNIGFTGVLVDLSPSHKHVCDLENIVQQVS